MNTNSPNPSSACPAHSAWQSQTAEERACAFDPFGDEFQADPAKYLRWAREQFPVFWSPPMGYWVVTRYDDIKAVFRDHRNFSPANALEKVSPPSEEAQKILASYDYAMNRTLVNEDEPAHMARRRLLLEPFTPQALKQHEPMVRRLTREFVDRFIDNGRADLVDEMLWEVPLTVALHFLGVDEDDMPLLRKYSIAHTVNTWGRPQEHEQLEVAHAVGNFWILAGRILEKMRRDPSGPGWMKFGIRMQAEHPHVVTDSYLHSMMMAGIVAAHETTANACANAIRLLLSHATAWQELHEDASLIPNAVEECLRFAGSIFAWRRVALNNVTIGGVAIPAGAKVFVVMTSGNHDERHFNDADFLDIHRDNAGDHLSFGYGAHQCMGKNLARMELQIFLEELTRRLPHLRLAQQEFTYLPNISFRGPEHLLVEWDPAQLPERVDATILTRTQPVKIGESTRPISGRLMRVEQVRTLTKDIIELRLVAADGKPLPQWSAGAHIDVDCGDTGLSRQYSLCGDPAEQAYTIAVLKDPHSRGGSEWIHKRVKPGDLFRVRGPRNHFRFDETTRRVVLIAGGIGITPIMALAQTAKELCVEYEFHYSGQSRETLAYIDDLEQKHGDRLHLHVSDERTRANYSELLDTISPGTVVYACGPDRMLDTLHACSANWPTDTLRVERFHSAAITLDPSKEHSFEVELKDSGLVLQVPSDRTLLDTLRAANIDVPSDCSEGLCGSCEVRVLDGAIDHRDVVLTRTEREQNDKMMTCCSRAKNNRLVLEL